MVEMMMIAMHGWVSVSFSQDLYDESNEYHKSSILDE